MRLDRDEKIDLYLHNGRAHVENGSANGRAVK